MAGMPRALVNVLTPERRASERKGVSDAACAGETASKDGYGRPYTITNAEGYTVTLTYDALDRPLRVTYPNNTYEEVVYDRLNVGKVRDLLGRWTTILVDSLKRPVAIRDPKNQVTQLIWCGCGGLSQLIDPKGHATTWTRDLQNRPLSRIAADNTATTYTYEATTSRLKTVTDAKAQTSTFDYFLDNRLKQVTHTGGTVATPDVSLTYDPIYPRVATRTDGTGTTIYGYNPVTSPPALGAARLATIAGPWANSTIQYGYDELGRTTSRSINGVSASVTYDNFWRPGTVTNALGTFIYGYDGNTSRLQSITSSNGPSRTYSYYDVTGDHQLQQILNTTTGGAVLSKFNYTYGPDNKIATWTQQLGADPATAKTYGFQYDAANRLTSALLKTAGAPQSVLHSYAYAYDDQGNRTSEQVDNVVTSAIHNVTDELTTEQVGGALAVSGSTNEPANVTVSGQSAAAASSTFSGQAPVASGTNNVVVAATDASGNTRTSTYAVTVNGVSGTLTYDLNGNLKSDGTRTYEWDAEDRLTAINQGAHRSEFSYDGLGRRVEIVEKDNGSVTSDKKYLWVGQSIAEERDSTGAATTKRFFAQGFQQGGQAYFYTKDHLGSIREVVDTTGAVRARYDYDPYGRRQKLSGDVDADFGYTGYFEHAASNLKLAWFRAYDASLGRWLSHDPTGGSNLYEYVDDDPVDSVDPDGLIKFDLSRKYPAKFEDYARAYRELARLKSTATPALKCFFKTVYKADLDSILSPGGDIVVSLERVGPRLLGRDSGGAMELNLDELFARKTNPDLFNATLLHELVHHFEDTTWWWQRGAFSHCQSALESAERGQQHSLFHALEPFLAEYYQYGRYLTYGGDPVT